MTDTYEQRAEMIRQMLHTYGGEINADRIKGYLTVLQPVPTTALGPAIRAAMGNATGGYPPSPGKILDERRWHSEHDPLPAAALGPAIGPGQARAELPAQVDGESYQATMVRLCRRAREIRAEGKLVPGGMIGRSLSWVCAAVELGKEWPLGYGERETYSAAMRAHEAAGNDASWWWSECERPTVTR